MRFLCDLNLNTATDNGLTKVEKCCAKDALSASSKISLCINLSIPHSHSSSPPPHPFISSNLISQHLGIGIYFCSQSNHIVTQLYIRIDMQFSLTSYVTFFFFFVIFFLLDLKKKIKIKMVLRI